MSESKENLRARQKVILISSAEGMLETMIHNRLIASLQNKSKTIKISSSELEGMLRYLTSNKKQIEELKTILGGRA